MYFYQDLVIILKYYQLQSKLEKFISLFKTAVRALEHNPTIGQYLFDEIINKITLTLMIFIGYSNAV